MKIREEQIKEMAQCMCGAKDSDICQNSCSKACGVWEYAERAITVGYRKQSDTVREFVGKVLKIGSKRPLCLFNEYGEGYIDCIENIKKIAKEYGVEVEK